MHSAVDHGNVKRMRTGSISGRLRTASDLEESGVIDKYQKGVIKDLIISGDVAVQQSLDKCEKGDTSSLEELIKKGLLARKQSIDLLDGLDFDFLNGIKTEDELGNIFDDDMIFDFGSQSQDHHAPIEVKKEGERHHYPRRTSSIDSTTSAFRMFDNMPVYRGHSFGDDSHFVGDMDNLYKEIESGGAGGHHSIFNHGAGNAGAPQDVELSAYAAHAVALQGGAAGGAVAKTTTTAKPSKRSTANASGVIPLSEFASNAGYEYGKGYQKSSAAANAAAAAASSSGNTVKASGRPSTNNSSSNTFTESSADDVYNTSYKLPANTGGVGFIGAYSPEQRRLRIEKFFEKRNRRVWTKKVKYDVRKNFADSRLRVKGRFVKKEDEDIMRELLDI